MNHTFGSLIYITYLKQRMIAIVYGVRVNKFEFMENLKVHVDSNSNDLYELVQLYKGTFTEDDLVFEIYDLDNYLVIGNTYIQETSRVLNVPISELNSENEHTDDITQLLIDTKFEEEDKVLKSEFKFYFVNNSLDIIQ